MADRVTIVPLRDPWPFSTVTADDLELRLLSRTGFGVPASRFMRAILHVYGVELHNLSPNSISQAAIFAAVCEG
jgi:hypothetical protein